MKKAREYVAQQVDRLMPKPSRIQPNNEIKLLVSGAQFFPAALQAIGQARRAIRLETYIFANDEVGEQFCTALCEAASRGVQVRLVLDGFGGLEGIQHFVPRLRQSGVQVRIFRPEGFLFRPSPKRLRRMHRKILAVDCAVAFVGGINLISDMNHSNEAAELLQVPGPRYDFAAQVQGPILHDIWRSTDWLWWQIGPGGRVTDTFTSSWWKKRASQLADIFVHDHFSPPPQSQGKAQALFLVRDNFRFRRKIERAYLKAIGQARTSITIANAYFVPGLRIRRALRLARKRGVTVKLLLQGRVEYRFQHYVTQGFYSDLLKTGVQVYEYLPGYLHAKVAVVDGRWATVGSSNLDPFSLLFAREANLVVLDADFAMQLDTQLERAMLENARHVQLNDHAKRSFSQRALSWVCYKLMRFALLLGSNGARY